MSGMVCMTRFTGPASYYLSERQQIVLADLQLIFHYWLRNPPTLIIDCGRCRQWVPAERHGDAELGVKESIKSPSRRTSFGSLPDAYPQLLRR